MSDPEHREHVTETPDVSYIKNIDVTHETSDVQIGGIVKFAVALFVLMAASCLLMWGMFRALASRTKEAPRSPMALSEKERLPPEPRLQSAPGFAEELQKTATPTMVESGGSPAPERSGVPGDPLLEIRALRAQWDDVLKNGPVDQNGKRYGLPIEKAKEEILQQGLPTRGQQAETRP